MALKILCFVLCFVSIVLAHASTPKKTLSKSSEHKKLLNAYKEFESQVYTQVQQALVMIDKYSAEVKNNASSEAMTSGETKNFEAKVAEIAAGVENLQGILEQLLLAHASTLISIPISSFALAMDLTTGLNNPRPATVPLQEIFATVNSAVNLTCASDGEPLSMCVWAGKLNEQREVRKIEEEHVQSVEQTFVDGRSNISRDELRNGKCTLSISSIKETDSDNWSCTLVSKTGRVFAGDVHLEVSDTTPQIYFTTLKGGLRAYSLATGDVSVFSSESGDILGVLYDVTSKKVYFSFWDDILRRGINESEAKRAYNSRKYRGLKGLAFDWITGNIFGVSWDGFVYVCSYRKKDDDELDCVTLLEDEGTLNRIAVDPTKGTMYWTGDDGFVGRAYMDGSDRTTIVRGLGELRGIAIDYQSSRLYWADETRHQIHSSNLLGDDYKQIHQLPEGSNPTGLALVHDRIYWADWKKMGLYSITKTGHDWRNVHTGRFSIRHLTTNSLNLPRNRTNHCAGKKCPDICVLTKNAFRCLP